jgi:hypothetical protein
MKRIMSTAFVILSMCFGLLALTPIFAVSGGPEVPPEGIPDRMDALSAAAELEKGNITVSGVAGDNQPVRSARSAAAAKLSLLLSRWFVWLCNSLRIRPFYNIIPNFALRLHVREELNRFELINTDSGCRQLEMSNLKK